MDTHRVFTSEGWKSLGQVQPRVVAERVQSSSAGWITFLLGMALMGGIALIVLGLRG